MNYKVQRESRSLFVSIPCDFIQGYPIHQNAEKSPSSNSTTKNELTNFDVAYTYHINKYDTYSMHLYLKLILTTVVCQQEEIKVVIRINNNINY